LLSGDSLIIYSLFNLFHSNDWVVWHKILEKKCLTIIVDINIVAITIIFKRVEFMTDNSTEKALGYAIGKTNWYFKTLLNKLLKEGEFGITNEQWIVLKVIDANPAVSQTEIAEKSQKDKTNITRILDILERNACIKRRKDARDRRMYRVHITEQGKKVLETVNPLTQTTEKICTQGLDKKKVMELIETLDAVCNNIKTKI